MGNDSSKEELAHIYKQQELILAQHKKLLSQKSPQKSPQSHESVLLWQEYKKNAKRYASDPVGDDYDRLSVVVDRNTTLALDPFILLRLDLQCSEGDLKSRFKTLLRTYHPDKAAYDSTNEFHILKSAYQVVKTRLDRNLHLQGALTQTLGDVEEKRSDMDAAQIAMRNKHFEPMTGSNFNNANFNSMFDTHKFDKEEEEGTRNGYESWMKDTRPPDEPLPPSPATGSFNSAFESRAKRHLNLNLESQLQQYVEPEHNMQVGTSVGFQPLGEEGVTDYSTVGKFTDLKKAYGEENILYQGEPKVPAYTTLTELKSARDKPVTDLSAEEKQRLERKKQQALEQEQQRQQRMHAMDQRITTHYTQLHGKALELPAYRK
jgi:curved DNA-binding protein CbpA